MTMRGVVVVALLLACAGCDGFVRARVRVVTVQGESIPGALLRLKGSRDHDLARFTDDQGCAYFSGVVAPVRHVAVTVAKPGYQPQDLRVRAIQDNCLMVHLARDGDGKGSVDSLGLQDCPCSSKAGYSPTMSARFKVTASDGLPVQLAALRRSDRPADPWSQVTDATGCLGVKWIVSAGSGSIPLVLEKAGYQPAQVEVPPMEERCYSVNLSPAGATHASAVAPLADAECDCKMFSGTTVWPEK
jgi:hypothetical protein